MDTISKINPLLVFGSLLAVNVGLVLLARHVINKINEKPIRFEYPKRYEPEKQPIDYDWAQEGF